MSSSKITPATKSLELTNDIVFKAVYGRDLEESKQALIPLLNLLLEADPYTILAGSLESSLKEAKPIQKLLKLL